MSAEGNTSNEELIDENLLTYKRRNNINENPNPTEATNPANKRRKRKEKDIGWQHGEMLNGLKQHWRCNYCGLVRHGGGVTRLKLHLVGHTDVRKCPNVPDRVVEEIASSFKLKDKEREKEKACVKRGKKKGKKKNEETDDDDDEASQSDSLATENDYYGAHEGERRNSDTDSEAEKDAGTDYEAGKNVSSGEKWKSWKHILENMLPGGFGKNDNEIHCCIQNALSHDTGTNNLQNQESSTRETTTTKCKEALVNTLISEKFATLCNLLRNTFIDENSDLENRNYFDFSEIDAKLKNGDYERSPQMFIRDLRKLWDKFEKVGRELVRVSNSLSIISRNNIEKEVGIQIRSDSRNSNQLEPDQTEPNQICNHCRFEVTYNCGVINCKGCNTTYHKSCINPLINPSINHWFCSSCMSSNLDLIPISDSDGTDSDIVRDSDSVQPCITAIYKLCKICGGKEEEDREFLVCAHPECPYKYYHTKCLTKCLISNGTQVRETGYCWYCPSCLCRVCLCDKDDDKIVLCDGCDEAYHIYCMDPPRESVPEGKWFCRKCSAKRKREKGKRKKNGVSMNDKKGISVCSSKNYDGKYYKPESHRPMDLLLNAVEMLNAKEKESNLEC